MSGMNKVILIGRLGDDPDTRYTASGAAVTNISLATSDKWKDKNTGEQKERTEWHRVVFFNRLAEVAGEYLRKGSQAAVVGKLQTDKWTDDQGVDRYTTKVIANEMTLLGSKGDSQGRSSEPQQQGFRDRPKQEEPAQQDFDDDDIPF